MELSKNARMKLFQQIKFSLSNENVMKITSYTAGLSTVNNS